MDKYILGGEYGHEPIPEGDLLAWARWMEHADRTVRKTKVTPDIEVSTVFLGLDHSFSTSGGSPILFETMVFGGPMDQDWTDRYCTWEQAEAGHESMVERVEQALKKQQQLFARDIDV